MYLVYKSATKSPEHIRNKVLMDLCTNCQGQGLYVSGIEVSNKVSRAYKKQGPHGSVYQLSGTGSLCIWYTSQQQGLQSILETRS